MRDINQREEDILHYLAQLQYLTVAQVAKLSGQAERTASNHLSNLVKSHRPFVKRKDYLGTGMMGRKPSIYYLSKSGINALEELGVERDKIKAPIGAVKNWRSTYNHKVWMIDFFVSLVMWARNEEHGVEYLSYDFQQSKGGNRNNKGGTSASDNRIDINMDGVGYIVPDGVFMVRRGQEKPIFGLFEQHNGSDTARIVRQIENHCVAISHGFPSIWKEAKHHDTYIANRVFIAFENEGCMRSAMYRVARSEDLAPMMQFFLFKLSDDVRNGCFSKGWQFANGQNAEIF